MIMKTVESTEKTLKMGVGEGIALAYPGLFSVKSRLVVQFGEKVVR